MKKSVPLRFPSLEIQEQGGLLVSLTLDAEALASLGTEAPYSGPVELKAEFSVGGKDILLLGNAAGAWALECSRCLAAVRLPFTAALERTYEIGEKEIDIAGELREALLLALPGKPLCRADCRGLCPRCGKDLNEGPCGCRLEPPNVFAKIKEIKKERRK